MEFIIEEPDKKIGQEIKANWDRLAKPLDGLGAVSYTHLTLPTTPYV